MSLEARRADEASIQTWTKLDGGLGGDIRARYEMEEKQVLVMGSKGHKGIKMIFTQGNGISICRHRIVKRV